jgi:alpha-N-arabinofuranosidase
MTAARLTIDPHFAIGPIRRHLFGGFVEHLGRHVYDGI